MKILVIGAGLQGRAAVYDLARDRRVDRVIAADLDVSGVTEMVQRNRLHDRVGCEVVDASSTEALDRLMSVGFDVIVDLLPVDLHDEVARAAIRHRTHLVHASYTSPTLAALADAAQSHGVIILPELGLDPGIDLVFLGEAVRRFNQVEEVRSYAAGFPEASAADNPLEYKITWTFEGVLRSYFRPAVLIRDGMRLEIPAHDIFARPHTHLVEVPGVGTLEAFANGNCMHYLELLDLEASAVGEMGRYVLRWPGHCSRWKSLVDLHLLDDDPVVVDGRPVDRRSFLAAVLAPDLAYKEHERDVAVVRVAVSGRRRTGRCRLLIQAVDRRDLHTGFFAMNRTVGFSAAIGALLIGDGDITTPGLLSPVRDVPYDAFVRELEARKIEVEEEETELDDQRPDPWY